MIKPEEIPTLYQKLKSHIARDFRPSAVTQTIIGGGGATSFSALTGTIANAQAPQFLLRDGTRSLTGSLSVDSGVTIDGVDISAHAADPNAHHAQQHSITGSDHTISGAALSLVGATATNTLGLITPSSNPGTAESVLKSVSGLLTLPNFTATTSMRTPLIDTASGNLTLTPAGGDVLVNGNIAAQRSSITTIGAYTANDTAGNGPRIALYRAGNVLGAETATVSANLLGMLSYRGHDGSAYMTSGAADIRAYASENFSPTANGATLRFYTTPIGSTTIAERLRIHSTGNVSILNTTDNGFALDVTGTARASTSLTTPLLTTATNVDLVINPAGTGAVQFPNDQTLRTSTFDGWAIPYTTGFQINEFAPVPGGSASVLTIGRIQADELNVRVFVANETRVDRGDEFWTKSFGIVALGFTTPASIGGTVSVKFENSPALAGAIFANNDWLLIRKLEIDSGLSLFNVWGQVATYVNNGDGTQNWTFTLRGGPTSKLIEKGSLGIDFGQVGAGLIHLSVVDASGSPYIKLRKWVSGSDPMTINGPNFKTYVQIGNLGSISNSYYTPAGFGFYVQPSTNDARFIIADDNGLQIRGASFKMYNSTLQTVDISATNGSVKLGTNISAAATTSLDFNGATGDLSIIGDLYTADVHLTQAEGILLNTGATDDYVSGYNTKSIQWFSDIDNPTGNALVTLAGSKATNDVYANLSAYSSAGIAKVRLIADSDVASTTDSQMYLRSQTGGNSTIYMFSDTISLQGINGVSSSALSVSGDITVSGNVDGVDVAAFKSAYDSHNHNATYLALSGGTLTGTLTSRAITPNADNTHDLGASGARWQDVYAVNLHVGTIVGTPSYSHSHAASDITSGTLDFARIPTTWTGALTLDADSAGTSNYVRWLTQTSTGKAWDLIGRAHDFATAAQQNDMLLTYYDGTTTHIVFQADNATRIVDFGQTPTVGGTAVSLVGHTQAYTTLTYSGLTAGHVLIASGATTAVFAQLAHSDLSGLTTGDPHTQYVKKAGDTMTGTLNVPTIGTASGNLALSPAADVYVSKSIGIGVTTAEALLHVETTSAATANFLILEGNRNTADTEVGILFKDRTAVAGGQQVGRIYADRQGSSGNFDLVFHGGSQANAGLSTEIMRLRGIDGKVGILQSAPAYTLDVTGTVRATDVIYAGSDIEMTGELLAANGSASVPSIAALSDTNTGLYWSAADTLAVTTGGVLRASFNSSGVTVASAVTVPTINTASGNLTIAPVGGTTSVSGALSLTGTLSSTSWNITSAGAATLVTMTASTKVTSPLIDTASGNLTLTPAGGTVAVSAALTVGTTATITGVTSIASGSVGAPGLTFTGDTNTGLYRSGVDAYSLVAGGAAIINVGATGAGVNAAYDNTAALKVQSVANGDITLFLKQKSGQTARMWRVEDSAGQELIVLDSQGNLQSGNPGFVTGVRGWQIAPIGNAEFNNITARGELHASIFVMDEFHASGGTLYIAPAGKLELDATVYTTTGIEAVFDIRTTSVSGSGSQFDIRTTSGSGSGSQFTWRTIENYFEITDPPSGHAMILSPGDIVRCKALGLSVGIDVWDVWGVVGRVEDMTDYYRYYYERKSGGADGLVIPAGTAIISYGAPGDGRIYLTADQNYAPYMQVFLSGAEPWNGQITPTVRIGRLDGVGLPGVSGIEQHGIVLSSDLSNASAPYLVASNLQMFQYKIDSEWNNGNPTARITADGAMKLGTDIDSASTTGFDFNPATGALTIGSASYPGTVNVRGIITVTGGSGIAAFTDANLDNIANGATFGRINNTIIGGGFIRVGSGDKDSTLNGWYVDAGEIVGQAAGVDQVVLDAGGKIMAGAGALQLDRTAFHVANSATSKGIQFYTTNTFTDANKAGRLWALNGTPYSMYMSAGRSTFDGDSTNAAGQIQLVGLGASGIAGASVEISGSTQIVEITASEIDAFGDLDMNGYDIIDANNCWAMRSTAAL
jgi:hypothetical protein